jgi:ATPase subunit of ABC transporter with duplicated ATPase domains
MAGRPSAQYPGAILIVTHDRYFLDNVTGWILELDRGKRHSLRGQLHRLAVAEAEAPRRKAARTPRISARWSARRNGSRPRRKARQAKSKARYPALRGAAEAGQREADPDRADHIPVAERLGQNVIDFEGLKRVSATGC